MNFSAIKCLWLKPDYLLKNHRLCVICCRSVYNQTKKWEKKYKRDTRISLEKYWIKHLSERWKRETTANSPTSKDDKFYCLSMFPYPSGKLHMGHVRVYTISDTMAHYHKMKGKKVIHPMGWDSFGLPAENAALLNNLDPAEWTDKNISFMKQQLQDLNLCFNWDLELSTCKPQYYKWTQYLFLKLFEAGLAYRKKALVNWDPVDQTVLADEQVDEDGNSWRSGAPVEKRLLKQWFLRTTKYSKSLLETIHELEEYVGVKAMQKHWIGNVDGCFVDFNIEVDGQLTAEVISVFCSHPELIGSASHINLHREHSSEFALLFREAGAGWITTEVLQDTEIDAPIHRLFAVNPISKDRIPLIFTDHHWETYRSSNVLGIPTIDADDANIASINNLKIKKDQEKLTREESLARIQSLGCGQGYMASSSLRDWLISRQRRWGTPIPVVHCSLDGTVPVPEKDLPVLLPKYSEDLEEWRQTTCPKCGGKAMKEADTMDTFVDSAWYFMRFTDPHNHNEIFSKEVCDRLMPVDLYIGGKEHAILHLYYARFISHFCADIGLIKHREPFKKLLAQGIIKGKTYRLKDSGKYISSSEVVDKGDQVYETAAGEKVEFSFEKMSKSKLNGVDPLEFVSEWGITLTRLFVLYAAAPHEVIHWDVKTDVIPGMMRWQMKLWRNVGRLLQLRRESLDRDPNFETEFNLAVQTNNTIEAVTDLFENSCTLSAGITHLMTLARYTTNIKDEYIPDSPEFERSVCAQVIMSTPLMPHFSSELWSGLCGLKHKFNDFKWDEDVLDQKWPEPSRLPEPLIINVWVNKKSSAKLFFPHDCVDQSKIEESALKHPKVKRRLKGLPVANVHYDEANHKLQFFTSRNTAT